MMVCAFCIEARPETHKAPSGYPRCDVCAAEAKGLGPVPTSGDYIPGLPGEDLDTSVEPAILGAMTTTPDQPLAVIYRNFQDFYNAAVAAFPNASIGEDNERQLIIYTGLMEIGPNDNPSIEEGESLVVEIP